MHLPASAGRRPVNASDWDAIAEVGGLVIVMGSVLGTIAFALLRMRFVTRDEHDKSHKGLSLRIDGVELGLGEKVGKEDMSLLNNRLYACEQQLSETKVKLAETNGLLKSNTYAARALERQIAMLTQNEIQKEKT